MNKGMPGSEVMTNGYTGALRTALLSRRLEGFPITVARRAKRFSSVVKGACLYGKITSNGEYAPFYVTAPLYSQAAASQKNIILTGLGLHLKAGDSIIIVDDNGTEVKTIDTVTEGVANTTVVVTVNLTNTYEVANNAKVYLNDGTADSAEAVVVVEDIDFSVTSSNYGTCGYNFGEFNSLEVARVANFSQSSNANLHFRAV